MHPRDHNLLYVAVVGNLFGDHAERGLFRSKDGGETWEKVLYLSDKTGGSSTSPWTRPTRASSTPPHGRSVARPGRSGSMDGGLYKSSNGGDTWIRVEGRLPNDGLVGKTSVSISPANPDRIWALVEAEGDDGGLYRSDDGGEDFDQVSVPHCDNHDLLINPTDNSVMINANDGGANVSFTGGTSWSTQRNQPTAEFYRVTVDNQFPYRVYGAQQNNSTASVPSRGNGMDFFTVGGGRERTHRGQPRGPAAGLRGELRRHHHRDRCRDPAQQQHPRLPRVTDRAARRRHAVSLPVERADPALAARREHSPHDLAARAPHDR